MRIVDPYVQLKDGACRSYDDWCNRIGETMIMSQLEAGGLQYIPRNELDDFEGVFKTDDGLQQLRLRIDGDKIEGVPADGGSPIVFATDQIVLRCVTADFVKKICEVNKFKLISPLANQPPGIAFAERQIGTKLFRLIIALDGEWIASFAARDFVNRFVGNCDSVALMTNVNLDAFPWQLDGKVHRDVIRIPTKSENFLIARDWFTTPAIGVLTDQIVDLYPEMKIIFDERAERIFLFGKEIQLKDGRPLQFLRGICELTSIMKDDAFAAKFLGDSSFNAPQTFRTAKKGVLDAIRKAFVGEPNSSSIAKEILPNAGTRRVKSGFQPHEVLVLSRPF